MPTRLDFTTWLPGVITYESRLPAASGPPPPPRMRPYLGGTGKLTATVREVTAFTGTGFLSATAARPFRPSDLGGLVLWLAADSLTGLSAGQQVDAWNDQSPKAHHATRAFGSPTYQPSVLNGKPMVRFSDDDGFTVAGLGAEMSGRNTYTVIWFMRNTSYSGYPVVFSVPTDATWQWLIEYSPSRGIYLGHTNGNFRLYDAQAVQSGWETYAAVKTGATSAQVFKNGTEITSYTTTGGGIVATPVLTGDANFGVYYNGSAGFAGDFGEVCIYDRALSTTERRQVETHFFAKHGLI
jgi:Concanavalin A-like lectin/glucanases superfamily